MEKVTRTLTTSASDTALRRTLKFMIEKLILAKFQKHKEIQLVCDLASMTLGFLNSHSTYTESFWAKGRVGGNG